MYNRIKKYLFIIALACLVTAVIFMCIPGSYIFGYSTPEGDRVVRNSMYFSVETASYGVFPFWTALFSVVWLVVGVLKIATNGDLLSGKIIYPIILAAVGGFCAIISYLSLAYASQITVWGILISVFLTVAALLQVTSAVLPSPKPDL